jgi:hypothetical protein
MYAEQLKQKEFLRNLVSIPDIIKIVREIINTEPENAARLAQAAVADVSGESRETLPPHSFLYGFLRIDRKFLL